MKKYKFYEDPGHGWLEVPREDIEKMHQEGKISSYSYQKNDMVYLEEDSDMSCFLKALRNAGVEYQVEDVYQEECPIRDYESYRMQIVA